MLIKDLPRVLIISSVSPKFGPGTLALNYYNALKNNHFKVDLLTKDTCIYKEESLFYRFCKIIENLYNRFFFKFKKEYHFFYKKDTRPPFPISRVVDSIDGAYDIVLILFWQGLLSYKTVEHIHKKLNCQVHFLCVDYSPMTGGCHFTGNCDKYQTGCGKCPAIFSKKKHDFTYFNIRYREKVLQKVKPIIYGNTYMINQFFKKSFLFREYNRLELLYPIIDNNLFFPQNKKLLRNQYHIEDNIKFICFFGAQGLNDERKGAKQLLEALRIFYSKLSIKEAESVLLLIVGNNFENIDNQLLFKYKYFGYVQMNQLSELYSLADVFLCPSINDAGPTMVNQSLSCGTPVVSFEIGTAIDMIRNKNTGYCAIPGDSVDFANGIYKIFKLSSIEYQEMSNNCRKTAIEKTSEINFVNTIISSYKKYI